MTPQEAVVNQTDEWTNRYRGNIVRGTLEKAPTELKESYFAG